VQQLTKLLVLRIAKIIGYKELQNARAKRAEVEAAKANKVTKAKEKQS
jgi:hypothetical protein